MNLSDALTAYRTYAKAEGKSPRTIEWVCSSVGYFASFLGTNQQHIDSLTGHDLRRFIIALQDKPKYSHHPFNKVQAKKLSAESIQTYIRGVKNFFSFLARESFIEQDPMHSVKLPAKPQMVVPTFSERELEKLLSQPDKNTATGFRDFAILLTFIDTAIRLSELSSLRITDVDFQENQFAVLGKGSKQRYVPFGRRLAKILMKYQLKFRAEPLANDFFWLARDGRPLSPKRIQKMIAAFGKKAGLRRCHPHKLRHTSALLFLRAEGNLFSLQKKLGHSSLTMTRRYSNLTAADVRDDHLKHSPVDRLKF